MISPTIKTPPFKIQIQVAIPPPGVSMWTDTRWEENRVMAEEVLKYSDVICVHTVGGTVLEPIKADGGRIYLLRMSGVRVGDDGSREQVPTQVFGFALDDLAALISRLFKTASQAGDGLKLCEVMARTMELDPSVVEAIGTSVDTYLRRN